MERFPFYSFAAGVRAAGSVALAFALMISGVSQQSQAQSLDRLERDRALEMLSGIKDELKKNYYDANFRSMDIEARFKASEEKLKQAQSLGQAFGIIAQTLLDLNDSHTYFIPPPRPVKIEHGWKMQMIGDKCFVVAVKPGSDADAKGLKPGDQIISLEGFTPTRQDFWKMEYYYYALSPRPGFRLVVQSPGGQPRQLEVAAKVRQEKRVLDLTGSDIWDIIRESENADRVNRHRFRKGDGLMIWKMPAFDLAPEQVDSTMTDDLKGATNLILDLRGNPGGYVVMLERLVSHFFDRELKIADLKGRKEMKPMVAKKRGGTPFTGKVVVLIDSKSGSAAELFARLMQLEKRGVVIGDQSSGSVMQSKYHGRQSGTMTVTFYGASITNADVIMSDGKSIEHVGVTPDEIIRPTAEDLAAGRDPVLARAAAILGFNLAPDAAGKIFPVEWK